jgi:hypothetical protein
MSEKPQKRLVSKRRYACMVVSRTTLLVCSVLFALEGARDVFGIVKSIGTLAGQGLNFNFPLVLLLCVATLIPPGMIFVAFCLWKKERTIERVAPITKLTIGVALPEAETLVRASDLPPSHQQTELLRATQYGKETPAEELLRASTDGQDT